MPFWVYHDGSLPKVEQERIFEGPVWNYLCLEPTKPAKFVVVMVKKKGVDAVLPAE